METLVIIGLLIGALVVAERAVNWLSASLKPAAERALLERARRTMPASGPTAEQRNALKGCANCGAASLTLPFRDASGRTYCSEECLIWGALGPTEFCDRCLRQTTDVPTGNMNRVNGIGRGFGGLTQRCAKCRSGVRRVWFTVLYLPLIPLGTYRVIHASPRQFWSRALRQV